MAVDLTQYDAAAVLAAGVRTNSIVPNPTATIVDGDLLLGVHLTIQSSAVTVTIPSGWTLIENSVITDRVGRTVWAYQRASGEVSGPTGTYTWTHASANTTALTWRIPGVILSGNPEDATHSIREWITAGPQVWTGITTGTANSAVIGFATNRQSSARGASPSYTERIDIDYFYAMANIQAGAGATGNKQVSHTPENDMLLMLLALKQQTGTTPITVNTLAIDSLAGGEIV